MTALLIYLAIVNLVCFALWGVDKKRAVKQQRRISEKQLLQCAAIGGVFGALAGMSVFRHKTLKVTFLWKFWLVLVGWVAVIVYVLLQQ